MSHLAPIETDQAAASAPLPPTTPNRRRTLINTQMRRIALGVRKIFTKTPSESNLGHFSPSNSFSLPSSPANKQRGKFRLQRTKSNTALTTERDVFPPLRDMWQNKTFEDLPCAKDLARLVRRVVLVQGEDEKLLFSAPSALEDEDTSLKRSLQLTLQLVAALTKELDGESAANALLNGPIAAMVAESTDQTDAEAVVRAMIASLGAERETKTVRLLKTINQDLIAYCTCELKEHITSRFMTKDVRTAEGWRIQIKLVPGKEVLVTHVRREQSVDMGGDIRNHWEFEWALRLELDDKVEVMKLALLRVTDLFLSETIDPKLEAEIKHDLRVGENIL